MDSLKKTLAPTRYDRLLLIVSSRQGGKLLSDC